LLDQKTKEYNHMKENFYLMQSKLSEREKVHQVNRDLVTKNCGQ